MDDHARPPHHPNPRADPRYDALFHDHPDSVFEFDRDGRFVDVNAALERAVDTPRADLLGHSFEPLVHPDDLEDVRAQFERALAGHTSRYTARHLGEDGSVVHLRITNIPIIEDGTVTGVYGIAHDVTAQVEAEERLDQNQRLLSIAGQIGKMGGWSLDAGTMRSTWSRELFELLEHPDDETPELADALATYLGEDRPKLEAALHDCLNDGVPFDIEVRMRTHSGESRWIRVRGEPEVDEHRHISRINGAFQDITDRKAAAEEARLLTEQLADTLESITDGFVTLDRAWRFTYVNHQAERFLRSPAEWLLGRDLWSTFPLLIDGTFDVALRRAMEERVTVHLDAYWYEPFRTYFELNIYPSAQGIAVYLRDVTERVEREATLERVIAAETHAVNQLRELDRTKNAFLSAVSHELRTPLTVVDGLARTLQRLRGRLDDVDRTRMEDALVEHAARLTSLLDDLLNVDRLARGTLTITRETFDVVGDLRRLVAESPISDRIELHAPEELPVSIDRVQTDRIVVNLLDNAAKYAPTGTVEVVAAARDDAGLTLSVRDRGPGIPRTLRERAFEPFYRLDADHPQPGTGVGLALVAEFARLHGGQAHAERPDDRVGVRIVVHLPGEPVDPPEGHDTDA